MKKILLSIMMVLAWCCTLNLTSCTPSKHEIVNQMVQEGLKMKSQIEAQGMKFNIENVNDDLVYEYTYPTQFTEEQQAQIDAATDESIAAALQQQLTQEQIEAIKKVDVTMRFVYKDATGQKVEKTVTPDML